MTSPYPDAGPQINPYAPTEMKTLVYSPEARIYILHNGVQYDVSADLIAGAISRKENSAATLIFTLANKPLKPGGQPRYNAGQPFAFSRMDVVTLYLKRTQMIQVFTGFLDDIPYRQLYPGVAQFRATCTIKKLMHTWWNPQTPANQAILNDYSFMTSVSGGGAANDGQYGNGQSIGGLLRKLLVNVGNWNPAQLHVQDFPLTFFPFVLEYIARNKPGYDAANDEFMTTVLGADHSFPPRASAGYNASAPLGTWPPPMAGVLGTGAAAYLPYIIAACDARGLGPKPASLQQSTALQAAGETGVSASDYDSPAWQQVANLGQAQSSQENQSDAAILAVACIMVESRFRNFSNPTVPESSTFPNDGPPPNPNLDSVGLFQQRAGWGNVSQRMNPYAAAGMFFEKLMQFGWRNMEPGAAIYKVQRGASPALYAAAMNTPAPELGGSTPVMAVQAYRVAQGKGLAPLSSAITNAIPAASSLASSVTNSINDAVNNVTVAAPTSTGAGPAVNSLRIGKPIPDSEGAINAAMTMYLTPYEFGGKVPGRGLDCSGLTELAFRCIGVEIGAGTSGQSNLPKVLPSTAAQRGDLLFPSLYDHVGIYLGAGTWINTGGPEGAPGKIEPIPEPLSMMTVRRACPNGGVDPTAPFTPYFPGIPMGQPAGTGQREASGAAGEVTEPIARNLFSLVFQPGTWATGFSQLLPGEKQFIDGQPLIQMVQALCKASLRNFQSAPNGDFMAYTPDTFGLYGKPAVLSLEDIEIIDFRIDLSDEPLTTHVYIDGDYTGMGGDPGILGWINTAGVATMENEPLFSQLRKAAPGDMKGMSGKDIMRKFGVRPYKQTFSMVSNPAMEFLLATQIFLGKFSSMYRADVRLTFMPELYPGMRVLMRRHNLTMYCSEVEHSFDYENGFSTRAVLSSPVDPAAISSILEENPLSNFVWPSDNFQSFIAQNYNFNPAPATVVVPE